MRHEIVGVDLAVHRVRCAVAQQIHLQIGKSIGRPAVKGGVEQPRSGFVDPAVTETDPFRRIDGIGQKARVARLAHGQQQVVARIDDVFIQIADESQVTEWSAAGEGDCADDRRSTVRHVRLNSPAHRPMLALQRSLADRRVVGDQGGRLQHIGIAQADGAPIAAHVDVMEIVVDHIFVAEQRGLALSRDATTAASTGAARQHIKGELSQRPGCQIVVNQNRILLEGTNVDRRRIIRVAVGDARHAALVDIGHVRAVARVDRRAVPLQQVGGCEASVELQRPQVRIDHGQFAAAHAILRSVETARLTHVANQVVARRQIAAGHVAGPVCAVLPAMIVLRTCTEPAVSLSTPAAVGAAFAVTVQDIRSRRPAFQMPPPIAAALPEIVLLLLVSRASPAAM